MLEPDEIIAVCALRELKKKKGKKKKNVGASYNM
jgi:hypothetical protein